jgi:hypothetical protein
MDLPCIETMGVFTYYESNTGDEVTQRYIVITSFF